MNVAVTDATAPKPAWLPASRKLVAYIPKEWFPVSISSTLSFAKISTKLTYFCANLMPNHEPNHPNEAYAYEFRYRCAGFFIRPVFPSCLCPGPQRTATCDTRRYVARRSEEHTSELQSLMRISYAVFCLKKKNTKTDIKQLQY